MVRRLRLGSGLVLLVFVLTHFLNHALGLVSLEALEAGRTVFLAFWRSLPATLLFYGSLLAHLVLSLWALFLRRRLAMPTWEAIQLVLGLAIPPLILLHILGTRLAHEVLEVQDSYVYMLLLFSFDPAEYVKQIVAGLVIWMHGCVGLHFWLRLRPTYRRLVPYAYAVALLRSCAWPPTRPGWPPPRPRSTSPMPRAWR
jgi:adenylate cyclase